MKRITFHLIIIVAAFSTIKTNATPLGKGKIDSLYQQTLTELLAMLEGKASLNFCRAVYLTENAYLGDSLDWNAFKSEVEYLAIWSKMIGSQTHFIYPYPDSNEIKLQYGIFATLTQPIAITSKGKDTIWTVPYTYDTLDFMGQQDWQQMFVSKLLTTGKGNCHSLPYLYKMIAEVLDIKAPLALAPNHIYLQMPTKNYHIHSYNIELTNGTHPLSGWIMASSYIDLLAIQEGLYMYPLTDEESIALVLVDLAQGWQQKYANKDETFALYCVEESLRYFPKCVNALLLKAELLATKYKRTKEKNELLALNKVCMQLLDWGYDQMPEEMYEDIMTNSSKHNRTPDYAPYAEQQKDILTLSKGRYLEVHTYDTIEQIGTILFNTETLSVVDFKPLQKIKDFLLRVEIPSRFWSVDPLGASFPELTPYQFASNSPIAGIDLDGLEFYFTADGRLLGQDKRNSAIKNYISITTQSEYTKYIKSDDKWASDILLYNSTPIREANAKTQIAVISTIYKKEVERNIPLKEMVLIEDRDGDAYFANNFGKGKFSFNTNGAQTKSSLKQSI